MAKTERKIIITLTNDGEKNVTRTNVDCDGFTTFELVGIYETLKNEILIDFNKCNIKNKV